MDVFERNAYCPAGNIQTNFSDWIFMNLPSSLRLNVTFIKVQAWCFMHFVSGAFQMTLDTTHMDGMQSPRFSSDKPSSISLALLMLSERLHEHYRTFRVLIHQVSTTSLCNRWDFPSFITEPGGIQNRPPLLWTVF
jgi:hypothetical protein